MISDVIDVDILWSYSPYILITATSPLTCWGNMTYTNIQIHPPIL
eukprot:UN08191